MYMMVCLTSTTGGRGQRSPSPRPAGDSYRPTEQSRANVNDRISSRPATGNRASPAPTKSINTAAADLHDIPDYDRYSPQLHQSSPQLEQSTTPDKRILAQHAILNLLPAKVQYQDYIDEGIDENLVGGLFDNLGLSRTRPKPVQDAATPKATDSNGPNFSGQAKPAAKPMVTQSNKPRRLSADLHNRNGNKNGNSIKSGQPSASKKETLQSSASSPTDSVAARAEASTLTVANGEERKDKIARLLAEKQKKQAPATMPSADIATPAASSQAAAKAEKDRLLNLKIENLRKSREARTLKNDAANRVPAIATANEPKSVQTTPISPLPTSPHIPRPSPKVQPQQVVQVQAASARVSPISSSPNVQSSLLSQRPAAGGSVPPSAALPPKPIAVTQQSPPAIPGLFLSAAGPSGPPSANVSIPPSNGLQRKRPVAADFDEPTPSSSYKRPFGQSRVEKPLVIDVSDDESDDDDEAMDLDQPESGQDSAGPILDNVFSKAGPNTREQAPSAERRIRQTTVQPNGPPQQAQSPAKPSKDAYKSKMDQIAELHKKIAEAEMKKKAKDSANRSGSQTPLAAEAATAQQKMVNEAIAEKNQASAELERLLEGADERAASQAMADAKVKEQKEASDNKKRDVERKRKRRSEIQLGLPAVDAEVEKNQQRLEELRAEMEKAQTAVQKALEDKQKLEVEMANLDDDAEEQLQTEQTQQQTLAVRGTPSRLGMSTLITYPLLSILRVFGFLSPARRQTSVRDLPPTHFTATPNQDSDSLQQNSALETTSSAATSKVSTPLQNGTSKDNQASSPELINPSTPQDVDMAEAGLFSHGQSGTSEDILDQQAQKEHTPLVPEERELDVGESIDAPAPVNLQNDRQAAVSGNVSHQVTDELPRTQSPTSVSADQVLEAALQEASAQAEAESQITQTPMAGVEEDAPEMSELERAASTNLDVAGDETRDASIGETSVQDPSIGGGAVGDDSDAYEPFVTELGGAEDDSEPYEPPEATPPISGDDLITASSLPEMASLDVLAHSSGGPSEIVSTNQETVDSVEPLSSTVQNVGAQISAGVTRVSHQTILFPQAITDIALERRR